METPINLGKAAWRQIRRLVILVLGISVVLVGIAMIVMPGPAFVVVPLGLVILSTEFVWARRLQHAVKRRILLAAGRCPHCRTPLNGQKTGHCPHCSESIGATHRDDASSENG